jgi:hypothetical protein
VRAREPLYSRLDTRLLLKMQRPPACAPGGWGHWEQELLKCEPHRTLQRTKSQWRSVTSESRRGLRAGGGWWCGVGRWVGCLEKRRAAPSRVGQKDEPITWWTLQLMGLTHHPCLQIESLRACTHVVGGVSQSDTLGRWTVHLQKPFIKRGDRSGGAQCCFSLAGAREYVMPNGCHFAVNRCILSRCIRSV